MASFVSPGNYVIEKDFSDYIPSLNSTVVGVLGFGSKGPVDKAILVTNAEQLINTFGDPRTVVGGQGLWGAYQILERTNSVYFVRAAAQTQSAASVNVSAGSQPAVWVSSLSGLNESAGVGVSYAFLIDVWNQEGTRINTDGNPYVIGVPSSTDQDTTIGTINSTIATYLDKDAPFSFASGSPGNVGAFLGRYAGAGAYLKVRGFASTASHFSALGPTGQCAGGGPGAINGPNGVVSAPSVSDLRSNAGFLNHAYEPFGSVSGAGQSGGLRMFGTPGVAYTAMEPLEFSWLHAAGGASGVPNSDGDASGWVGSGVYSLGNTMAATSATGGCINLASLHPGLGYNYSSTNTGTGVTTYGLRAAVSQRRGKDSIVDIQSDGGTAESNIVDFVNDANSTLYDVMDVLNTKTYGNNETSDLYYARFAYVDDNDFYVGAPTTTRPTTYSGTFTAAAQNGVSGSSFQSIPIDRSLPLNNANGAQTLTYPKLVAGNMDFVSGINGDAGSYSNSLTNTNIVQALVGSQINRSGMQAFRDDTLNLSMAMVPGITTQAIQNNLVTVAEQTQNFLAVLCPPVGLNTAQDAINWHNGKGDGRTSALNSSYAALYWSWLKTFNVFTATDAYLDPGVYAIRQMAYTDEIADPWFAPAGLRRGRLTKPTDVEVKLTQGDRDSLYAGGNVINPIVSFPQDGLVIFGQRTTQRASTALDRINVRRLVIQLRKQVLAGTRRFVFEPNDAITRQQIVEVLQPTLQDIKDRRGLDAFKVICDETTNTPARVDRNELWCKLIIQPTKTAEILIFEINVTSQTGGVASVS